MNRRNLSAALAAHRKSLSDCRRCALAPEVRPILSFARRPEIMLVGQAPGKQEISSQKPFAGRAGRTLFGWLERAGLGETEARDRIYIAAITRCFPGPSPNGRGDRVPSLAEREACAPWLDRELELIRPRLLILVGRLAIDRFLGAEPLDSVVGRRLTASHAGGESVAIALPHPSGASSWPHKPANRKLLDSAIELLASEFAVDEERRSA